MNASLAPVPPHLSFRITFLLWASVLLIRPVVAGDTGAPPSPVDGRTGKPDSSAISNPNADRDVPGVLGRSDKIRFFNDVTDHYSNARGERLIQYFFFPPEPPPLGSPLRLFYPPSTGVSAPAELAGYVNEPFYSLLGVRLTAEDLPRRLQLELAAYRSAKMELQNELRSKIAHLKEASAATRQQELAAFALVQTPKIVELETTAAQLRTDLQRSGMYGVIAGRGDWNEARSWRLPASRDDKATKDTLQMEYEVMRAAACFQDGLSPAQRRLVREIAMELNSEIHQAGASSPAPTGSSWFFFLPETARIRVPADLPAGLAREIDGFVSEKALLKAELRDALRQYDGADADERTRALKQLAVSQAPRIAALEERGEAIRRALADVPDMPGPPPPPPMPGQLVDRISLYRSHKAELLEVLHAELVQTLPVDRSRESSVPIHEQVTAFNREHAAQFAQLTKERDGIREALAQVVRSGNAAQDRKSINDLLEEFENARQAQEVWEEYRDYQVAVLLPGLSPEQRRLLYDAAVEKLALPLPTGEVAR
jgi:hypothetical protein